MASYESDYGDIRAAGGAPRGLDPNYRGGYGGMRMRGSQHQAPYGFYRQHHTAELEHLESHGRRPGPYDRELAPPRTRPDHPTRYDRETPPDGAVHDWRERPDAIRHYNANSPILRDGGRREDHQVASAGRELRRGRQPYGTDGRPRGDYGNRGLSGSGFSEPWARGPMPGSR
jgi:hypothetical protein